MPQGWNLGVLGSKTLAWGFAMASHRLRGSSYCYCRRYSVTLHAFPKQTRDFKTTSYRRLSDVVLTACAWLVPLACNRYCYKFYPFA